MKQIFTAFVFVAAMLVAGCWKEEKPVAPHSMTPQAVGRYCGMNIIEHSGPKGQIILKSVDGPIWFSSARDTIAFTMMPDEPKDIAGIFVSDMGAASSWENPGADNWIDARKAFFVIESRREGGMGGKEAVPFGKRTDAEKFVAQNSGRIVAFDALPQAYILSGGSGSDTSADSTEKAHGSDEHAH